MALSWTQRRTAGAGLRQRPVNSTAHRRVQGRSAVAALIQHSETLITWAATTLTTRRPARKGATPAGRGNKPPADT